MIPAAAAGEDIDILGVLSLNITTHLLYYNTATAELHYANNEQDYSNEELEPWNDEVIANGTPGAKLSKSWSEVFVSHVRPIWNGDYGIEVQRRTAEGAWVAEIALDYGGLGPNSGHDMWFSNGRLFLCANGTYLPNQDPDSELNAIYMIERDNNACWLDWHADNRLCEDDSEWTDPWTSYAGPFGSWTSDWCNIGTTPDGQPSVLFYREGSGLQEAVYALREWYVNSFEFDLGASSTAIFARDHFDRLHGLAEGDEGVNYVTDTPNWEEAF